VRIYVKEITMGVILRILKQSVVPKCLSLKKKENSIFKFDNVLKMTTVGQIDLDTIIT